MKDLYPVQQVVHPLFDHIVDFLQGLQHLPLLQSGLVVLFKQAVDGKIGLSEFLKRLELLIIDFLLDLGHLFALAVHQLEEILLEGVEDQLFVLQLLLQGAHLLLHLVVPEGGTLASGISGAFPLDLLVELQQKSGHLAQLLLHGIFASHQFVQQLYSLHLVALEFDSIVGQLVGSSIGCEVLSEALELIQLEGGRVDLF